MKPSPFFAIEAGSWRAMARRLRHPLAFGLAATLICMTARAAEPESLTVKDCVNIAMGYSPELKAQNEDLAAAKDGIWAAQASLFPKITGTASAQELNGQPTGIFNTLLTPDADSVPPGRTFTRSNVKNKFYGVTGATLTYPIFQNGSIMGFNDAPAVESAKASRRQQEWTKKVAELTVVFDITSAFYNVVWFRDRYTSDKRKASLAEQELAIVRKQRELGMKLDQDVKAAEENYKADKRDAEFSAARLHETNALLAKLLGLDPEKEVQVSAVYPPMPKIPDVQDLLHKVMMNNPTVGQQQAAMEVAEQTYRITRSNQLPVVTATTSYTAADNLKFTNPPTQFLSALTVTFPLFDFGAADSATSQARHHYEAAKDRVRESTDTVCQSVIDTLTALRNNEDAIAALTDNYYQAKSTAALSQAEADLGGADPLLNINNQLAAINAFQNLGTARYNQWLNYARLENAAAGAWKWQP